MPDPTVTERDRELAVELARIEDTPQRAKAIAQAIATARREGAEDMRERAAKVADHYDDCISIGAPKAIRSLPVEQEDR